MTFKPRPYQKTAATRLAAKLRRSRAVVAVSPTGSGKTAIGVAAARAVKAKRVVWLAHRYELLAQAERHLLASGAAPDEIGWLSGRRSEQADAAFLLASIDMPADKLRAALVSADLVVIDEAHRSRAPSYLKAIRVAKKAMLLGLTATPWRLDGAGLGTVYRELYLCATQSDLIADKYIAQPVTYGVPKDEAAELVRGVAVNAGDYAHAKLGAAMSRRSLMGKVVAEWERLALGRSTLVFAASREHARKLCQQFKRRGHAFAYLDGETPPAERDQRLADLASGALTGVVNVDVLIEGFDCPAVKCVVLARPTRSLTRYLQQVGRGSRRHGNMRPIVIDHAGNVWRFGLPEAERAWSLEDAAVQKVRVGRNADGEMVEVERTDEEIQEHEAELKRLAARADERDAARKRIELVAKEQGRPKTWVEGVMQRMFA